MKKTTKGACNWLCLLIPHLQGVIPQSVPLCALNIPSLGSLVSAQQGIRNFFMMTYTTATKRNASRQPHPSPPRKHGISVPHLGSKTLPNTTVLPKPHAHAPTSVPIMDGPPTSPHHTHAHAHAHALDPCPVLHAHVHSHACALPCPCTELRKGCWSLVTNLCLALCLCDLLVAQGLCAHSVPQALPHCGPHCNWGS